MCLASVQSRVGHPNLGQESEVTASVAATFYNLYNFRGLEGGRPGREEAERGREGKRLKGAGGSRRKGSAASN
jgi:hypothetical protein